MQRVARSILSRRHLHEAYPLLTGFEDVAFFRRWQGDVKEAREPLFRLNAERRQ